MNLTQFKTIEKHLESFVAQFGKLLGRAERLYWCKQYLAGLLLDGERKSIGPMAARLTDANVQSLQQFVNQSPWEHRAIQLDLVRFMLDRRKATVIEDMPLSKAVAVLQDTTLLKEGKHSVGVTRQFCRALNKVANCQSIVTWHYVDKQGHFPLLGELYLPQTWTADPVRLERAGVPEPRRQFREKWRLALELLDAIAPMISVDAIICDAYYGEIKEFLHELEAREYLFVVEIPESYMCWPTDVAVFNHPNQSDQPRQYQPVTDPQAQPIQARDWVTQLIYRGEKWQSVDLPLKRRKQVEVMAVRVRETDTQLLRHVGPERLLLIERAGDEIINYYLSNAHQRNSVPQMVRWAHEHWKVEQGYRQMEEELGLGHFEGRSWRGLHHHVTLCFMAYCFLQMVKKRGGSLTLPQRRRHLNKTHEFNEKDSE